MKDKMINYYMKVAEETAKLSYARRLKVGAIVVKLDKIISIGYNGTFPDDDNNCEDEELVKDITEYTQLFNKVFQENIPVFDGSIFDTGNGNCYVIRMKSEEEFVRTKESPCWQQAEQFKFYRLTTKLEVCHAEANALNKLTKSHESSENASLFLTHNPCFECAKNIILSGITSVYYKHKYRTSAGINLLIKKGIKVKQIS
jgi:deoxycytidylate deaminase